MKGFGVNLTIIFALGFAGNLAGCGEFFLSEHTGGSSSSSLSGSFFFVVDAELHKKAMSLMESKCSECHAGGRADGGFGSIGNVDAMISSGHVKIGKSGESKLNSRSADGSMPPSSGLSQDDKDTIKNWIDNALAATGDTPTAPETSPLEPTFSSISANIFVSKCLSCHGPSLAEGGIRFDSFAYTISTGSVDIVTPSLSSLYIEVNSETMPEPPASPLSAAEKAAILTWISAGALNN
jgi:mono/diheme cytochrome c family protein